MLAHYLYELRRQDIINKNSQKRDLSKLIATSSGKGKTGSIFGRGFSGFGGNSNPFRR